MDQHDRLMQLNYTARKLVGVAPDRYREPSRQLITTWTRSRLSSREVFFLCFPGSDAHPVVLALPYPFLVGRSRRTVSPLGDIVACGPCESMLSRAVRLAILSPYNTSTGF